MTFAAQEQTCTPAQYLERERNADYKSEYINGYIFAMAGASRKHNLITGNIYREISLQLKGRTCESYISDMRVKVESTGIYTYPDVVAACDTIKFDDKHNDTLINPVVIIEVLSDSTEAYDRGEKFAHYRRLKSLHDYILVSQNKVCVEHFVRKGSQWILFEYNNLEDTIHVASIKCDLIVGDLYDKVNLTQENRISPVSKT